MSNPYLPKWEYIPDGETRVFGNRVYMFTAHMIRQDIYLLTQVGQVIFSRAEAFLSLNHLYL